jgi:hypothetical protein
MWAYETESISSKLLTPPFNISGLRIDTHHTAELGHTSPLAVTVLDLRTFNLQRVVRDVEASTLTPKQ